MKFKLDENLGVRGAIKLRDAGHDVATVSEQALTAATDAELAEVCRAERRCLVTLDLDFANPLIFEPTSYAGLVVLRISGPVSERALDVLIATLIDALSRNSVEQRLWIVEPGRIREYLPPSKGE